MALRRPTHDQITTRENLMDLKTLGPIFGLFAENLELGENADKETLALFHTAVQPLRQLLIASH